MSKKSSLLVISLFFLMTACVSSKKYTELGEKKEAYQKETEKLRAENDVYSSENTELKAGLKQCTESKDQLIQDSLILNAKYKSLKEEYDHLKALNADIEKQLEAIFKSDADENKRILSELELNRLKLQKKEDELRILANELDAKKVKLEQLSDELIVRENRIVELETVLEAQKAALENMRAKIAKALKSFEGKGLTITNKNGRIYVSMEANLLFPSGSTDLNDAGKRALKELAIVLSEEPDLNIMVEGHTDSDALSSPHHPKNNWELSVLRATSVVELMLSSSTMSPKKITAAGRSEFLPLDPNDKSKNRRIEIIINPDLDELFDLISK